MEADDYACEKTGRQEGDDEAVVFYLISKTNHSDSATSKKYEYFQYPTIHTRRILQ